MMTTDTRAPDTRTPDPAAVEDAAVEMFAEKVLGDMAGAYTFFMAGIGDRLGLFKDLAARGPATSQEFADRNDLAERYVREWQRGMAAAGYLDYDPATTRYTIPSHREPVLAEEAGPAFFGAALFNFSTNFGAGFHQLLDAFRTGAGIPQDSFDEAQEATARFTAPWFEHLLVQEWLPAMPDLQAKLDRGASVCDIGCGQGRALIKLAEAFPRSTFVGYDAFQPAVQAARRNAAAAGVAERIHFEVLDAAQGIPSRYDVITTFDVLHDSADPAAILRAIHAALAPDGRYVCVDINCSETPEDNVGPTATVLYGMSLEYCLPVSLNGAGTGLGTVGLPQSRLTELATDAGFTAVRRVPIEEELNNLYELTP
jgi:2-polyprenyl-3-methyl-5-hydroxy-6-metoxy-1,4-benzoquinol methylase